MLKSRLKASEIPSAMGLKDLRMNLKMTGTFKVTPYAHLKRFMRTHIYAVSSVLKRFFLSEE